MYNPILWDIRWHYFCKVNASLLNSSFIVFATELFEISERRCAVAGKSIAHDRTVLQDAVLCGVTFVRCRQTRLVLGLGFVNAALIGLVIGRCCCLGGVGCVILRLITRAELHLFNVDEEALVFWSREDILALVHQFFASRSLRLREVVASPEIVDFHGLAGRYQIADGCVRMYNVIVQLDWDELVLDDAQHELIFFVNQIHLPLPHTQPMNESSLLFVFLGAVRHDPVGFDADGSQGRFFVFFHAALEDPSLCFWIVDDASLAIEFAGLPAYLAYVIALSARFLVTFVGLTDAWFFAGFSIAG